MIVGRISTSERIIELLSSSPRSIQQLLELTNLPGRTLRYHLRNLRRQNIIEECFLFSDRRRKVISLSNKFKKLKSISLVFLYFGSVKAFASECSAW